MRDLVMAAMADAELKAWEGLRGYKFWMFGYHAARWVNMNALLPRQERFRSPFRALVEIADKRIEAREGQLAMFEVSQAALPLLGSEGDGA